MKYGIFGCTADPFTPAHYEIVNKALNGKLVDKVIIVPTVVDYYRKGKTTLFDLKTRQKIIEKWFDGRKDVILDFHEYDIADKTYKYYNDPDDINRRRFWHTLRDIQFRYDYDCSSEFYTIVGGDSWNNLESWFNFKELGKATKFIVVKRNGEELKDYHKYEEYRFQPYHVFELDSKLISISATKIREQLLKASAGVNSKSQFILDSWLNEIDEYKNTKKMFGECYMNAVSNEDKLIAHTPIFDLMESHEVEAGFKPIKVKSPDWVSIIVERDGKFLMEKQLRHGLNKEFEEFPCGMVEEGEQPIAAALRELEEEVGMKLNTYNLTYLGKFAANPAFMTNYMHYFYIKPKSYDIVDKKLDEHEHLTSYWIEKNKAFENFISSEGSSILGCAWMLLIKNGIVNEWND